VVLDSKILKRTLALALEDSSSPRPELVEEKF
jgi:hypothetical protein